MAAPTPEGRKRSKETRRKISEAIKKRWQEDEEYRQKCLEGLRKAQKVREPSVNLAPHIGKSGPENANWKGGKTTKAKLIRTSDWYKDLVKKALVRDDYTCQECGERGGDKHVHHIVPFAEIMDDIDKLRDMSNLVTLCPECHYKTDTYGSKYDSTVS